MATEVLAVDGVGAEDNFALGAGASKAAAVASPDDEDTTYLVGTELSGPQRLTFANPAAIVAGDAINSVTIRVRARRTAGFASQFTTSQHDGTSESTSSGQATADAYGNFDYALVAAPSGGAWTLTKVQALSTLVSIIELSVDERFTTVTAIVDYTPASSARRRGGSLMVVRR